MKKIISYFIKYPVAVNVLIFAFIIFGFIGAKSIKSSFFPLTDSKTISINLIYPGASPSEMEEGVVLKIEDNLKGIVGVDRVTSVSRENSATITVETLKGKSIDELREAAEELKAELSRYSGVFDISDSFRSGKQEIQLSLLPEARNLGLTLADLAGQVRAAFYGTEAQRMQRGQDDVRVMVRFPEQERKYNNV